MSEALQLVYKAPGPIAERFLASRAFVELIMGPVGSGKTGLNLMKHVFHAREQRPSLLDGVRRYKLTVVRDTYRQLWQSVLPSWFGWVPKTVGSFQGEKDGPASHLLRFRLPDRTLVEYTADFLAIGEHKVEDVLRGRETTAFYLNELDLLAVDVMTFCLGRVGRFPSQREGGPNWYGITADFNAPDVDSPLYALLENLPEGWEFFEQPSGLSPEAENIANLPEGYYERQATGQPDWYVQRMIENKFGASRAGRPIYPEYNDRLHGRHVLKPIPGRKILLGLDAGGSPAAVFGQHAAMGQWLILDELTTEPGTGPTRFGALLAQRLADDYRGFEIEAWADPSAFYGGDKETGEGDWIRAVEAATGLRIRPAPTNSKHMRWDAVRLPLTRMLDGHHPGLRLGVRCKLLRRGFLSDYRFRKLAIPGEARYSEDAEKNEVSHPHDGLQYVMAGGGEYDEVLQRKKRQAQGRRQVRAIDEEHPRGAFEGGPDGRQATALEY